MKVREVLDAGKEEAHIESITVHGYDPHSPFKEWHIAIDERVPPNHIVELRIKRKYTKR